MSKRSLPAALAVLALAACTNAGTTVGALPSDPSTTSGAQSGHRGSGTLSVRIRIPHKHRAGHFVSPSTKGLLLAFTGPATIDKAVNLTPAGNPACTPSTGSYTCTVSFALDPGAYSGTITTYDQAPVNGTIPVTANQLSLAKNVPFAVSKGIVNTLKVTLSGVPSLLTVGGFPTASAGTSFLNGAFTVTVKDADGNVIVGSYSTPVVLTDGDTLGHTSIVTAGSDNPPAGELLGSGDTAAINYTGAAMRPVQITATAGSASGSALFGVQNPIYVASQSVTASVLEIPPGCQVASCVLTLGSGFDQPASVAVDQKGNLFVADTNNHAIKEIPAGCTTAGCIVTIGSGAFTTPSGVAVDANDNIFVSDVNKHTVSKTTPSCTSSSCVTTIDGSPDFDSPERLAIDASGNLFVPDGSNGNIVEIPAGCTAHSCEKTLGGGFQIPEGVAVDASDNVFVADTNLDAIYKIPAGCTSASCVETIVGGLTTNPDGIAVDGLGNVFFVELDGQNVVEIPPGCTSAACLKTIDGGFTPGGIEGISLL